MKSIGWGYGWQALQLSPWWLDSNAGASPQQEYLWEAVKVTGQAHARSLIGDACAHAPAIRSALEAGSTDLARLSDARLADHLATLVADGTLVLQYKVTTADAAKAGFQIGPAPKKAAGGAGNDATVKSVIQPAFAMPQRAAPAPAPAEEAAPAGDFDSVDQDLQAAALVQAAVDGVPFCEVCEKAKRERAAKGGA